MKTLKILPGTGRGTMRSMVEGARHARYAQPQSPSTASRSPSPQAGRI